MTEIERLREALDLLRDIDDYGIADTKSCDKYECDCEAGPLRARIRAALASAPPVAERGEWQTVPVEPTREMWAAAGDAVVALQHRGIGHHDFFGAAVWTAMLAAAPPSPSKSSDTEGQG